MEKSSGDRLLVTSHYEINRIITGISESKSAITLYLDDTSSTLTSFIDVVDCRQGYMLLKSPQPVFRQPLLIKSLIIITCKYQDSIVTIPEIELVKEESNIVTSYISAIPKKIYVLQRRSFYRQIISKEQRIHTEITLFNNVVNCKLKDISLGGCKIQFMGDLSSYITNKENYNITITIDTEIFFSTHVNISRIKYDPITNTTQLGCKFIALSNQKHQLIVDLISIINNNRTLKKTIDEKTEADSIRNISKKSSSNQCKNDGLDVKKNYQNGLTTIQSIINHFRLGKKLPIEQIFEYSDTLFDTLLNDRQSLVILSRVRTIENYYLQQTLSFAINLADFLMLTYKQTDKKNICEVITGCLLHNTPQSTFLPSAQDNKNKDINHLKDKLLFWHEYIANYKQIKSISVNVIENHLEFSDGTGIPLGKFKSNLDSISLTSSGIYQYDQQSHIFKDNAYFYHPVNYKKFERGYLKKLDPIILHKLKEHYGNYPLGSTIQLKNKKLAIVMRHNESRNPSYVRVVYDIESKCPTIPLDIELRPSDIDIIEGLCNPSYYKIQSVLVSKYLKN